MRKTGYRNTGITLVELLVAMTIFSIVIGITFMVLLRAQKVQKALEEKHDMREEAARVIYVISSRIKGAQKLVSGTDSTVSFFDIENNMTLVLTRNDTLFVNDKPVTDMAVPVLRFEYIAVDSLYSYTDFYDHDFDRNGILDSIELKDVAGIKIYLECKPQHATDSSKANIKKETTIMLRNK